MIVIAAPSKSSSWWIKKRNNYRIRIFLHTMRRVKVPSIQSRKLGREILKIGNFQRGKFGLFDHIFPETTWHPTGVAISWSKMKTDFSNGWKNEHRSTWFRNEDHMKFDLSLVIFRLKFDMFLCFSYPMFSLSKCELKKPTWNQMIKLLYFFFRLAVHIFH